MQRGHTLCLLPSTTHRIGNGNGLTASWYGAERKMGVEFWLGGGPRDALASPCNPHQVFPRIMARHRHVLRNRSNFQRMFDEGTWVRTEFFKLLHRPNALPHNRIGIMVGRRFGNAVRRNRAKRVFREVTRHGRIDLAQNTDLVFFPKQGMDKVPYHVVNQTWQSLLANLQKLPVE